MSDNTPTAARVQRPSDSHWYTEAGEPCYAMPKKGKEGGTRPTTLADARKLNLLPSVTTIIKILHKEQLVNWMIEQGCLAVATAPHKPEEPIDQFVARVLQVERQQDQESKIARERGTELHDALEDYFSGNPVDEQILEQIKPAALEIQKRGGEIVATEKVLVGNGYAGKTDLITELPECWYLWDYKSTKKLPDKGAWDEHRLQLAGYGEAYRELMVRAGAKPKPIKVANCYISTQEPGRFVIWEHENWEETYEQGFAPLVQHWQWRNGYRPSLTISFSRGARSAEEVIEEPPLSPEPTPQAAAVVAKSAPVAEGPVIPQPAANRLPGAVQTDRGVRHVKWDSGVPARQQ